MTQFSFNGKPVGVTVNDHDSKVCRTIPSGAFQPVMVFKPGIEAIMEGLRLANIESIPVEVPTALARDVDT